VLLPLPERPETMMKGMPEVYPAPARTVTAPRPAGERPGAAHRAARTREVQWRVCC